MNTLERLTASLSDPWCVFQVMAGLLSSSVWLSASPRCLWSRLAMMDARVEAT